MSLRERFHEFKNKKTVEEMYRVAADEVFKGGVFNVALGKGNEREFLNVTMENLKTEFPKLMAMMEDPQNVGKDVRFTIMNKDHQKVDGFSGKMIAKK